MTTLIFEAAVAVTAASAGAAAGWCLRQVREQKVTAASVNFATERAAVEKTVAGVENVRAVVNELVVAPNLSMSQRSNDSLLGAKVKAQLVDAKDVAANAYRVVAERGVIYLLGRVTEREATRAVEIARAVSGVVKVVRVLDIISEEELAAMSGAKK